MDALKIRALRITMERLEGVCSEDHRTCPKNISRNGIFLSEGSVWQCCDCENYFLRKLGYQGKIECPCVLAKVGSISIKRLIDLLEYYCKSGEKGDSMESWRYYRIHELQENAWSWCVNNGLVINGGVTYSIFQECSYGFNLSERMLKR